MTSLAEKLRVEAARKGWNQVELAKQAGISQTTVSKLYRGVSEPTLTTAVKLARALEIDLAELAECIETDQDEEQAAA